MRFSRSFCLLLTEFLISIRTENSVRSLPLCQILQIFTVNFQKYFRSKYKFCKIFEGTRSLNLHLRESGVLARARTISGPGRARQETISSHLNMVFSTFILRSVESKFTLLTYLMANNTVITVTSYCTKGLNNVHNKTLFR